MIARQYRVCSLVRVDETSEVVGVVPRAGLDTAGLGSSDIVDRQVGCSAQKVADRDTM